MKTGDPKMQGSQKLDEKELSGTFAAEEGPCHHEDPESRSLFDPPLYRQRYLFAVNILTKNKVKSAADLGCSDGSFFKLLETVPTLEQAALVDIDLDLLESRKNVISPELRHFVYRRTVPLNVSIYCGSAGDFDCRLQGLDAITLIEVIEHLYPDVLDQVTCNVFGHLRPHMCVVTTPNADFNVLFGNEDPTTMRHWDHKFEWSREEFKTWCTSVCVTHNYTVEYTGIGFPFTDQERLQHGPCSQAAIFTKADKQTDTHTDAQIDKQTSREGDCSECYKLISSCDFPFYKDCRSLEEKIDDQVGYCIRCLALAESKEANYGDDIFVSLASLAKFSCVRDLCEEEGIRNSVIRCGYSIDSDNKFLVTVEEEPDDFRDDNEDELGFDSESMKEAQYNDNSELMSTNLGKLEIQEDWDAD